jgi:hypothetical protein
LTEVGIYRNCFASKEEKRILNFKDYQERVKPAAGTGNVLSGGSLFPCLVPSLAFADFSLSVFTQSLFSTPLQYFKEIRVCLGNIRLRRLLAIFLFHPDSSISFHDSPLIPAVAANACRSRLSHFLKDTRPQLLIRETAVAGLHVIAQVRHLRRGGNRAGNRGM